MELVKTEESVFIDLFPSIPCGFDRELVTHRISKAVIVNLLELIVTEIDMRILLSQP